MKGIGTKIDGTTRIKAEVSQMLHSVPSSIIRLTVAALVRWGLRSPRYLRVRHKAVCAKGFIRDTC